MLVMCSAFIWCHFLRTYERDEGWIWCAVLVVYVQGITGGILKKSLCAIFIGEKRWKCAIFLRGLADAEMRRFEHSFLQFIIFLDGFLWKGYPSWFYAPFWADRMCFLWEAIVCCFRNSNLWHDARKVVVLFLFEKNFIFVGANLSPTLKKSFPEYIKQINWVGKCKIHWKARRAPRS
jgi:hypothetical protein